MPSIEHPSSNRNGFSRFRPWNGTCPRGVPSGAIHIHPLSV
jgi:hypothetical protein